MALRTEEATWHLAPCCDAALGHSVHAVCQHSVRVVALQHSEGAHSLCSHSSSQSDTRCNKETDTSRHSNDEVIVTVLSLCLYCDIVTVWAAVREAALIAPLPRVGSVWIEYSLVLHRQVTLDIRVE